MHPLRFPPSPDPTAPSSPRPPQPPLSPRRDHLPSRAHKHHHGLRHFSPPSSSSGHCPSPALQSTGIGRKVAESLQLFKQSEERPPKSETPLAKRRYTTSHSNDAVEEARYEFVKRADWPDPETAALRRERSTTGLENVRVDSQSRRVSLTRDPPFPDPSHWRKDVPRQDTILRGRRRRRPSDASTINPQHTSPEPSTTTVPQSPCIRPRSRAYPPSPSPSRSPTDRIPPLALYNPAVGSATTIDDPHLSDSSSSLTKINRSHSRSPTPTHISLHTSPIVPPPMLPSPTYSSSSWSTDDESAWETSSITSDISTTSGTSEYPFTFPQVQDASIDPFGETEKIRASLPDKSEDDAGSYGANLWNADFLNMVYGDSEESLPHIPLRPFRNQVGGHSAIYKFTRRAVCKPLVSRENQFYEAVEREAPPLLGFIPRYLGVMLVTYRRVLRDSVTPPTPHPAASFPVGASHFSGPMVQRALSEPEYSFTNTPYVDIGIDGLPRQDVEPETLVEEAELPEVALDRNRHIIPKWLLHRSHFHDVTHSRAESLKRGLDSRQHFRPAQLSGATTSSPALIQNQDAGEPTSKRRSLSRQSTLPLDDGDSNRMRNAVGVTSSFADTRTAWGIIASEGPQASRTDLQVIGSQQSSPSWFGGTGSTTVNTRLKDHIFSTILRRFHRRANLRWLNDLHIEDEREAFTREGQMSGLPASPQTRSTSRKQSASWTERPKVGYDRYTSPIRRVRSDGEVGHDGQNSTFDLGYDKLEDFFSRERSNVVLGDRDGLQPSFTRRRSRSRIVDSPVYVSSGQPPNQPISSLKNSESVPRQHHFILMEDLTGRLKCSCVLDLKMGTRQYGMDAISSKKKSQRKKCDRTTSRLLGVRVCGMQVWNHATQSYVTQNKYMGRDIRREEFPSVLASFLHDGERLLVWHIPVLLQKLYALARIVSRLKGFRFYGCSLLLIYDGDHDAQEAFRVSALEHPSSRSKRGESLERPQMSFRSRTAARSSLRRTLSEDLLSGPMCRRSGGKRKRGEVNVRIVDFAHTTTGQDWAPYPPPPDHPVVHQVSDSQGYQAEVDAESGIIYARFPPHYPAEPDRGFLFGLKSLTETLEKIWNDERMRRIKVSREDPSVAISQLSPLVADGREIFDEIFGSLELGEDPGMLST